MSYNVIHIHAYGDVQVISNDQNINILLQRSEVKKEITQVLDYLYSLKPSDSDASSQADGANIFFEMFVDYQPKTGNGFRIPWKDIDPDFADGLVAAVIKKSQDKERATKPQKEPAARAVRKK